MVAPNTSDIVGSSHLAVSFVHSSRQSCWKSIIHIIHIIYNQIGDWAQGHHMDTGAWQVLLFFCGPCPWAYAPEWHHLPRPEAREPSTYCWGPSQGGDKFSLHLVVVVVFAVLLSKISDALSIDIKAYCRLRISATWLSAWQCSNLFWFDISVTTSLRRRLKGWAMFRKILGNSWEIQVIYVLETSECSFEDPDIGPGLGSCWVPCHKVQRRRHCCRTPSSALSSAWLQTLGSLGLWPSPWHSWQYWGCLAFGTAIFCC